MVGLHTGPRELLDSKTGIENIARKTGGKIFFSHDLAEFEPYVKAPDSYGA